MRNKNEEKGAVIVEATFVIPMFVMLVITIMWVANLCTAQAKIQVAINSAAKEIASYSYLYGLTGVNDYRKQLANAGKESTATVDTAIDGVGQVFTGLGQAGESGQQIANGNLDDAYANIKDSYNNANDGVSKINTAYEVIKKDPKSFLIGLGKASASVGIDYVTSCAAGALGKFFSEKHLTPEGVSANAYLQKLGVVGGFEGIDFSHSQFCSSGGDDIVIVAQYQLSPIKFFNIDVKYNIVQTARTKAWFVFSDKNDSE